jgi:hypothetical protein
MESNIISASSTPVAAMASASTTTPSTACTIREDQSSSRQHLENAGATSAAPAQRRKCAIAPPPAAPTAGRNGTKLLRPQPPPLSDRSHRDQLLDKIRTEARQQAGDFPRSRPPAAGQAYARARSVTSDRTAPGGGSSVSVRPVGGASYRKGSLNSGLASARAYSGRNTPPLPPLQAASD